MRRLSALGISLIAGSGVAGCGGQTHHRPAVPRSVQAASCLKNAIANQFLNGGTVGCGNAKAAEELGVTATCTQKVGNEFICQVGGKATQLPVAGTNVPGVIRGGFYNVTFDGSSIVYQPMG